MQVRLRAAGFLSAWVAAIGSVAGAGDYRLTGVGTASAGNAFGSPGEEVTISLDLSSDDFVFSPTASTAFRFFDPTTTAPISVVGAVSGPYPNVEPVEELLALSSGSTQFLDIDVRFGNTNTTLFRSNCNTTGCFDINTGPADAAEFLDLLAESVNDPLGWTPVSFSNFYAGSDDTFLVNGITWSIEDLNAPPVETLALNPTIDAQLRLGGSFLPTDGSLTLAIDGGFGVSFPALDILAEFPLADLPDGADIVSASLLLDTKSTSNELIVEALGYEGDGQATFDDRNRLTSLLGVVEGPFNSGSDMVIDLDPTTLETLVGQGDSHIGVRLTSQTVGPFIDIAASEDPNGFAPLLTIEYLVAPTEGDFNADGVVDAADYTVWRDNASGEFTPADYDEWVANFGAGVAPNSAGVPEPTAAALLGLGLVFARPRRV